MNTASVHTKALRLAKKYGVPVTFTRSIPAVDASGVPTGATTTRSVLVHCVDNYESGDPAEYQRLGLSEAEAPALFGVPDVVGTEPDPMMECTWASTPHTVRSVKPFRPFGETVTLVAIIAK